MRQLDIDESANLNCRGGEIIQVVTNLLTNALDAISENETKNIRVKYEQINDFQVISVIDSGNEIPKEIKAKMMDPFFTTKGVGKGTGLGLSISKGILKNHGGDLVLDDSSGETTFKLFLPVERPLDLVL